VQASPRPELRGERRSADAAIRLDLLDAFGLSAGRRRFVLSLSCQRLLAFLAFQPRPRHRNYVAGRLWPGTTEIGARACLRSALWRLRSCCEGLSPLEATRAHLWIARQVAVDVRDQVFLANRILGGSVDLDDVDYLSLLEGELLPDWDDDWVRLERQRLRQLRLHAIEALATGLRELGRYGDATEAAFAALRVEPLRESTHRVLIETYLAEGNRAEAVCHYREYAQLLERRLALEPEAELKALIGACGAEGTKIASEA
jgi:DNA-binding SARP family transcriptional activator